MKRKPVVHSMTEKKNGVVTTRCGLVGNLSFVWTAWHCDVTCFECLNGVRCE